MKKWKIRTQFAVVFLMSLCLTFLLFVLLWYNKWLFYGKLADLDLIPHPSYNEDDKFWIRCTEEALKYDIPEIGTDEKTAEAELGPFFDLFDPGYSIFIYGAEDGHYRAGRPTKIISDSSFRSWFNFGYSMTDGLGEDMMKFTMQFKNGYADVMIYTYYRSFFAFPFLIFTIALCTVFFISLLLFFVGRKLRLILVLEDEVLLMASGNLTHTVPGCGEDEIGILARELNNLRITLSENILREAQSRKANQDLITAMSHDLRTPLTILNGYLEVLKLNRNPQKQEEYLSRCLKKTSDIKEMTDRMFEYALIYEEAETPELIWISTDFIRQCLLENCDFIHLAGFTATTHFTETTGVLKSDKTMLKRIFNNLFSNILKYGDKGIPVQVNGIISDRRIMVTIENSIKQDTSKVSGNNIGLKSVEKMMRLLEGEVNTQETGGNFLVELTFPLR